MRLLAHGIGVVRDLPIPAIYFFVGATIVLVVVVRPPARSSGSARCSRRTRAGGALPGTLSRSLLSRRCGSSSALFSVGLLVLTLATALFGTTIELLNFAPDVRVRGLLARHPAPVGPVRERLVRAQPVARDRRRDGVGHGARRARGAPGARVVGAVGAVPGGRARSSRSSRSSSRIRARLSAHARDRVALYTYWALAGMAVYGRDAVDAVRRGLRGRVRAARADRAVRGARRRGRRPLAVHRARRRRPHAAARSSSSRSCSARRASTGSAARARGRTSRRELRAEPRRTRRSARSTWRRRS